MVVAIGIAGAIGSGLAAAISHLFRVSADATEQMRGGSSTANAGFWVGRDAKMAQSIQTGALCFPLRLEWVDWGNEHHLVTYEVQGMDLHRREAVGGVETGDIAIAREVATGSGATGCQFADGVLTFWVSSAGTAGAQVKTVVNVAPRSYGD
jgi:hypothetical protein